MCAYLESNIHHFFCKYVNCCHGRPQTFFQGRAKFSRGAKHTICLKNIQFSFKKVENKLFWPAKGVNVPPLVALPCRLPWFKKKWSAAKFFFPQIIVNNSRNLSDLQVVMKFFLKYWTLLKDDSLCRISTLFEVYECIMFPTFLVFIHWANI